MAEHLFGFHTIEETLRKGVTGASLLVSRQSPRIQKLREAAEDGGDPVSDVEDGELAQLCGTDSHRGAVLVLSRAPSSLPEGPRHMVSRVERGNSAARSRSGRIHDPQNLGAILRSADRFFRGHRGHAVPSIPRRKPRPSRKSPRGQARMCRWR